LRSRNFHTAA